ncbi:MAG: Conserved membrane protein [Parcubacteria bacterium C7867-003]|nr:MAG: Conserved membrane protein [Parcubacteria bacterium C7867-003]
MKKALLQIKNWQTIYKAIAIIGVLIYLPLWFLSFNFQDEVVLPEKALPVLGSDSFEYKVLADNIISDHFFTLDLKNPEYFRTPGYPFFIAFFKLISGSYFFVTLIQILLTLLTGYLIYLLARGVTTERWAVLSAVLFLLEPSVILHSMVLLSDVLYVFLIVLSTYILFNKKETTFNYFCAGLVVGVSCIVRPISVFLPILVCLFIIYKSFGNSKMFYRFLPVFILGFLIVILPWMVRNKIQSGYFTLSSISSYNLFYYNASMFLSSKIGIGEEATRSRIASENNLQNLDWRMPENSKSLDRASLEILSSNLFEYSYFHLYKTTSFFFGSSLKVVNHVWYVFFDKPDEVSSVKNFVFTLERLLWLFFWIVLLFSLLKKEIRVLSVFCITMVLYFAILTGPVAYARYRLPALPYLFIVLPVGLTAFWFHAKLLINKYVNSR